jgi:stearoyl-CoA desaturase (Delta-9 desaturase)
VHTSGLSGDARDEDRARVRWLLGVRRRVLSWAASHRRHHAFTDVPGDPHSPHLSGDSLVGQLKGLAHADLGWLFRPPPQERSRWIPELCAVRDLVLLDRLFPLWCAVSLGLPTLPASS